MTGPDGQLVSWTDTATRQAIVDFVERVTQEDGPDYVPPSERIAVFRRPALRLLVLHDDAEREFDYTTGAETSLEKAATDGWTVVSIKNDWSTVFTQAPA